MTKAFKRPGELMDDGRGQLALVFSCGISMADYQFIQEWETMDTRGDYTFTITNLPNWIRYQEPGFSELSMNVHPIKKWFETPEYRLERFMKALADLGICRVELNAQEIDFFQPANLFVEQAK